MVANELDAAQTPPVPTRVLVNVCHRLAGLLGTKPYAVPVTPRSEAVPRPMAVRTELQKRLRLAVVLRTHFQADGLTEMGLVVERKLGHL